MAHGINHRLHVDWLLNVCVDGLWILDGAIWLNVPHVS